MIATQVAANTAQQRYCCSQEEADKKQERPDALPPKFFFLPDSDGLLFLPADSDTLMTGCPAGVGDDGGARQLCSLDGLKGVVYLAVSDLYRAFIESVVKDRDTVDAHPLLKVYFGYWYAYVNLVHSDENGVDALNCHRVADDTLVCLA